MRFHSGVFLAGWHFVSTFFFVWPPCPATCCFWGSNLPSLHSCHSSQRTPSLLLPHLNCGFVKEITSLDEEKSHRSHARNCQPTFDSWSVGWKFAKRHLDCNEKNAGEYKLVRFLLSGPIPLFRWSGMPANFSLDVKWICTQLRALAASASHAH